MNILVTGASGLVGRDLIKGLVKNKTKKIFAIYNLNKTIASKNKNKKIEWIKHNLKNELPIKDKIDYIVHCAVTHHFSANKNQKNFKDSNIESIKNLIKFSKKKKIKLLINLSTISIYGKIKKKILKENYKPLEASLLGRTKKKAEDLLKKSNLNYISLRLPGILCSNLNRKNPVWIQKLIISIIKKKNIHVYDINNYFNNLIDTKEITKLIQHLFSYKKNIRDTFNFSASNPIRLLKIIKIIKKKFKSNSLIINTDDNKSFFIDSSKLKKKINYHTSSTSLILKRYITYEKI